MGVEESSESVCLMGDRVTIMLFLDSDLATVPSIVSQFVPCELGWPASMAYVSF
jgi:hypothetical protein